MDRDPHGEHFFGTLWRLGCELALVSDKAERLADDVHGEPQTTAVAALLRSLDTAVLTTRWLCENALAGPKTSLDARASFLRMRSAAVQLELDRLRVAEDEAPEVFAGRISSVRALTSFVLDRIRGLNAALLRERARIGFAAEEAPLLLAERAFERIGADPDVSRLLADGARANSDRVRASCRMLSLLLGVTPLSRSYLQLAGLDCI